MITILKRIFHLGRINIFRNAGLSLAAIFIISVVLIFAVSIFTVRDFGELLIKDVEDRVSISVYFKEGVDEETILELKDEILEIEETESVEYFSRSETLNLFIDRYKDNPVIMASLAEVGNPFLASLIIKSETTKGYEVIASYLTESPSRIFFEKIDYDERKEVIENIFNITSTIRSVGLVLVLVLSFIAILIVFNIIRLAIYGMREEIKIMKLVGVSNAYIRNVFVFQGFIIGFISFLISFLFVFGFGLFFGDAVNNFIPGLDIFTYLKNNFLFIVFVQIAIGLGLAILSSLMAIGRYLKN